MSVGSGVPFWAFSSAAGDLPLVVALEARVSRTFFEGPGPCPNCFEEANFFDFPFSSIGEAEAPLPAFDLSDPVQIGLNRSFNLLFNPSSSLINRSFSCLSRSFSSLSFFAVCW